MVGLQDFSFSVWALFFGDGFAELDELDELEELPRLFLICLLVMGKVLE